MRGPTRSLAANLESWRRLADLNAAEANGYVAAITKHVPARALSAASEQELGAAARAEATAWFRGYVFAAVYRRRNRWWWQRLRSSDVPSDMSRLEFVLTGVGKVGTPKLRRSARALARQ